MTTTTKNRDAHGNEWTTTKIGPIQMCRSVEDTGPEEARALLAKLMPNYRHADPTWVTRFANMMKWGQWKESAEPIYLDDVLGLVNGRRRLLAVIESGCTVRFVVMRGAFEFIRMDQMR